MATACTSFEVEFTSFRVSVKCRCHTVSCVFKKGMSSNTKAVWGPAFWITLHSAAASCGPSSCDNFKDFVYAVAWVLPCTECQRHLRSYLQQYPMDQTIADATTASRYCFDLHNYVNVSIGKPVTSPQHFTHRYGIELNSLQTVAPNKPRRLPRAQMPYRVL